MILKVNFVISVVLKKFISVVLKNYSLPELCLLSRLFRRVLTKQPLLSE